MEILEELGLGAILVLSAWIVFVLTHAIWAIK